MHVIALDLPGHGFTSAPEAGEDITFNGQLLRIRQVSFTLSIKLFKVLSKDLSCLLN
jgi:hypothetical protein